MEKSAPPAKPRKGRRTPTPTRASQGGRTTKVSITVDAEVLRAITREAKRSGRTLSAQVTEALARDVRRRRLQELVAEHETRCGAITAEELAAVQAEWLA